MDSSNNLRMLILIISPTCALFESYIRIMFLISSVHNWKIKIGCSVTKWESGSYVLPLSINKHWFLKKELKISFFLESQLQMYGPQKVVECRNFYRLTKFRIDYSSICTDSRVWYTFVRSFCNIQFHITQLNFLVWLVRL